MLILAIVLKSWFFQISSPNNSLVKQLCQEYWRLFKIFHIFFKNFDTIETFHNIKMFRPFKIFWSLMLLWGQGKQEIKRCECPALSSLVNESPHSISYQGKVRRYESFKWFESISSKKYCNVVATNVLLLIIYI